MNENMVSFFTFAPLMTIGSNTLLWIIALLTVIIVALSLVLWSQYKKTRHSQKEMDRGQMLNDQLLDIYFLDTLVMDKFGNIQQMNQACLIHLLDISEFVHDKGIEKINIKQLVIKHLSPIHLFLRMTCLFILTPQN